MRILQLISSAGFYGAEAVVLGLSKALNRLENTSIICVFDNLHLRNVELADHAKAQEVPLRHIQCNGRLDWRPILKIREIIRSERIDVLHTHGYKADLYGYFAIRGLNKPILSTCHLWVEGNFLTQLYGILDRLVLTRFDMTVGVSEAIGETLRHAGVSSTKVKIINNGVDVAAFTSGPPTLRSELRVGTKDIIGTVARLAPQKGIEYLLQAVARLLPNAPDISCIIIGEGPERARLQDIARDLGIEDHVVFLGRREDMAAVYASIDILVLPSLYEGLPIVILEGLAAKKAVVASRVGAVPKVILHESTGLLVEPMDVDGLQHAILRLLTNRELRQQLGEAGHAFVQSNFSVETMADQYLDVYHSLLRSSN
jgi:glycosyltransferase involved in cell wall biosynthesis